MSAALLCSHCGERNASCIGRYEDHSRDDCPIVDGCAQHGDDYACDECCAHGNEDGACWPLADIPGVWQTMDINLTAVVAERDRLEAQLSHTRAALIEACRIADNALGRANYSDAAELKRHERLAELREIGARP